MGLISSDDEVEKITKSKEYTEHTAKAEWMDGETREYVFDGMKKTNGDIVLKDYRENREGRMTLQAFLTLPKSQIREFKTIKRETKKVTWEEEKKEEYECPKCSRTFKTERGREIHKAQKHHFESYDPVYEPPHT